jgi:N-acetylgalactosamine-N,N'-diacetylbacillosaminyl-diphospho-undecaprenol 4-alpha-N-acetylgalactosaminyltransferase
MRQSLVFAINSLAGGGAERVFTSLLGGSRAYAEKYDISVVLLDNDEDAYRLPDWASPTRLDCGHSFVRSIGRLHRFLGARKPSLAVSFLTRANVATALSMALRRRPFILSERVDTSAHLGSGASARFSRMLVRLTYPRASALIAVSSGVADTLVRDFGVKRERIHVAANPVDVERITSMASEQPSIEVGPDDCVAMGRLVPNKNFALAIRAFAASGRPGRLIILGEGPERAALEALARELGLADRCIFPGFAANPYAVLARAGLFILSSNAEGFPNSLVEAMAVGTPVVSTDCRAGPSEILDTAITDELSGIAAGRGGYLVRPNDPEAMAAAIALVTNEARDALSSAARARAGMYTVDRAVAAYWDVIESVLEGSRLTPA